MNLIFDWSGVIKDAFTSHLWVVNNIFRKYGKKEFFPDEFRKLWENYKAVVDVLVLYFPHERKRHRN